MIEFLFEWSRYVEALTPLLVASGCVFALEVALLVVARRRRELLTSYGRLSDEASARLSVPGSVPSRSLESVALLGPTIIAGVLVELVVRERTVIGEALRGHGDGAVFASLAERVLLPVGLASVLVASLLASVVFALAASTRLHATNLVHAARHGVDPSERAAFAAYPSRSPRAMVALVVGVVSIFLAPVMSVTSYATWIRARGWDEAHGMIGADRLAPIFAAQRASRAALDCALVSIAPAFVLALLYAAIVLRRTSPSRARARLLGRESPSPTTHGELWRASVALVLAIALAMLASPMRRENATPWPSEDTRGFDLGFATPQVVAPDDATGGAVVVVEDARTTADRVEVSPGALEAMLARSRRDHAVVSPDTSPAVLLICTPRASSARVFDALSRTAAAGIDRVVFGFENTRASMRPLIGPITYRALAYARVSLRTTPRTMPRATSAAELVLRSGDTRTCDPLSSRIGAARRRGQAVTLLVGEAMPGSTPGAPER